MFYPASFTPTTCLDPVWSRLSYASRMAKLKCVQANKRIVVFSCSFLFGWALSSIWDLVDLKEFQLNVFLVVLMYVCECVNEHWAHTRIDFETYDSVYLYLGYFSFLPLLTHMDACKKCRFLLSRFFIIFYFFCSKNNQWLSYISINHDFVLELIREKKVNKKEQFLLRSLNIS